MGERLIHDEIEKQAYWRPESVAIAFEGVEYTYRELNQRVNRVANVLKDHEIGTNDRLLAHGLNHADWYTIFFACSKLGATFCPVSKFQSVSNLEYITRRIDPEVVCYTDDPEITDKRLSYIREEVPDATYFSLDPNGSDTALSTIINNYHDSNSHPRTAQTTTHNILWTSGTTDLPKAVVRDHHSSLHFPDNLTSDLLFDETNVRLVTNPMMLVDPYFHYGLPTIMNGGTIVISRRLNAPDLYELIDEHDVNSLHLGFTLARVMVEYISENDVDLDLNYLTGVVPSANMASSLYELTDELYQVYGTTEIGLPLVKFLEPPFQSKPPLGKPGIGADIRIASVDESSRQIPDSPPEPGETGQLICRGEVTMTGYLDEEHNQANIYKGWIYPGDVVKITDERDIVFIGRTDDRIRSGGVNVYPSEVENVLENHEDVENATVVGVEDEKWGNRICALIVPKPAVIDNHDTIRDSLSRHCRDSDELPDELRPKEYAFVSSSDEIPTGAQEKEDRSEIIEKYFSQ